MKRKIFFVLFLALFLVLFSSQINAFELNELTANRTETIEGVAVEFTVSTEGAPSESFYFEWDFGDGVNDSTVSTKTSHAFYISGLEKEINQRVKVSLKQNNETIDSKEISVKVSRSGFKPQLLQPLPFSDEALERNSEQKIRLIFLDSFRQQVPARNVSIVSATLNNQDVLFEPDSDGFFSAEVLPDDSFELIETLEIQVKATGFSEQSFSLPVFIKPRELKAENPFTEQVFFGSLIEGPKIEIYFSDGKTPEKGKFFAVLNSEKLELSQLSFSNSWAADFSHVVTESNLAGMSFFVYGESDTGLLDWTEFNVPLKESSPKFRVSLSEPGSGESVVLGLGQNAVFSAEVYSVDFENLKNIHVWVESPLGKFELGDDLSAKIPMPLEQKELEFLVLGSAELNSEKLSAFTRLKVILSDKVDVNFLFPSPGFTDLNAGDKLKLALYYPNGAFYDKKSVNAKLLVDDKRFDVELTKGKDMFYYADFPFELEEEEYSMELILKDGVQGTAKVKTVVRQAMNVFLLLGVMLVTVVALFVFYSVSSKHKVIKAEKKSAEIRLEQITLELKTARAGYFKRKLTDAQYRDKVLKLNQEKQLLKKKL